VKKSSYKTVLIIWCSTALFSIFALILISNDQLLGFFYWNPTRVIIKIHLMLFAFYRRFGNHFKGWSDPGTVFRTGGNMDNILMQTQIIVNLILLNLSIFHFVNLISDQHKRKLIWHTWLPLD